MEHLAAKEGNLSFRSWWKTKAELRGGWILDFIFSLLQLHFFIFSPFPCHLLTCTHLLTCSPYIPVPNQSFMFSILNPVWVILPTWKLWLNFILKLGDVLFIYICIYVIFSSHSLTQKFRKIHQQKKSEPKSIFRMWTQCLFIPYTFIFTIYYCM